MSEVERLAATMNDALVILGLASLLAIVYLMVGAALAGIAGEWIREWRYRRWLRRWSEQAAARQANEIQQAKLPFDEQKFGE